MITPKELSALARVCKQHGISYLRTPELEVRLDPTSEPITAADSNPASSQPSEEDILFWSSTEATGA
jgi:hypothetical protein